MPSPESSRRNLRGVQNPWTERSRDESLLIRQLTLRWWMQDAHKRNPRTQQEWAEQLDVAQSYVAKMVRQFKREWLDLAVRWPEATLDDLNEAQEMRKRARAQLAEERAWEQYDAERRREQTTEHSDGYEDEIERQPVPDDKGWEPHPDPQLRGLVWVPRQRRPVRG